MRKNMYCTFDTETVGGAVEPEGFYHIGGLIHDREGNVYASFNLLCADMYEKVAFDDYAKNTMYIYEMMLYNGEITVVKNEEIALKIVNDLLEMYNVNYLCAFNTGFDLEKTKARVLKENRHFVDIFLMAVQTIGQQKKYSRFCHENNLFSSSKKNISNTAETYYAFLTKNPNYKEEHTAIEDAKIELDIFLACLNTKRRFTRNCHFANYEDRFQLFVKREF